MAERDPAEARLWWLTLARLAGVVLVLAGMGFAGREVAAGARPWGGLAAMLAGLLWFLFVPRALLKRWRGGA
jgi:hypothetical protein